MALPSAGYPAQGSGFGAAHGRAAHFKRCEGSAGAGAGPACRFGRAGARAVQGEACNPTADAHHRCIIALRGTAAQGESPLESRCAGAGGVRAGIDRTPQISRAHCGAWAAGGTCARSGREAPGAGRVCSVVHERPALHYENSMNSTMAPSSVSKKQTSKPAKSTSSSAARVSVRRERH